MGNWSEIGVIWLDVDAIINYHKWVGVRFSSITLKFISPPTYWLMGIEFPERKGIYLRNISVFTKMGWSKYEMYVHGICISSPRMVWLWTSSEGKGAENRRIYGMGLFRKWSGIDLGSTTVRQSLECGQIMPTGILHYRWKIKIQKRQCWNRRTFFERLASYLPTDFRGSIVHQASRVWLNLGVETG